MKQYRAYFFDLYGTLVDIHTDENKPSFWRGVAACYTACGADWDAKLLRAAYQTLCAGEEARLREEAPAGAQVEPDLTRVFAALYRQKGVEPDAGLLARTALLFRRSSTTHLRAYAGARELLQRLRACGREVVLLSNAQACFTRPELEQLGLADCFDRIFISSEVGFRKPDPRFYRTALQAVGQDPGDCLMIGNDSACDIAGAAAVGMDAFYIHSKLSPQPMPDRGSLSAVGVLPEMDLKTLRRLLTKP